VELPGVTALADPKFVIFVYSSSSYFFPEFVLRLVISKPSLFLRIGSPELSLDLRLSVFS